MQVKAEYPTAFRKKRLFGLEKKMEKQRSPGSAPFGAGIFKASGVYRPMLCTVHDEYRIAAAREVIVPTLPMIGSMSPARLSLSNGCVPAVPASVSPGKSYFSLRIERTAADLGIELRYCN